MKKYFLPIVLVFVLVLSLGMVVKFFSPEKDENNNSTTDSLETEIETENEITYSNLSYSAVGDSITYGFCGDHSRPPFANNYPTCVGSFLGLKEVNNFGACGCLLARTSNSSYSSMIDKVDLIPSDTDIISIFGGINDYVSYVPLGDIDSNDEYTIYGALNAIASKLTTNHKDAFVFFITPLELAEANLLEVGNNDYTIRDVCEAIKAVGEKWDIPVYDANLYAGFEPDVHSFDGCHPTEAYYSTIFAPKIAEFIRQNYRGK